MLGWLLACTRSEPVDPIPPWPDPPYDCEGFEIPARPDTSACGDPAAADPAALVACTLGSGHAGLWTIDDHGLPAYALTVEHRCDPAGQHWSPRPRPQGDPICGLGNGRGLMAMARASGAVELYTQDRGHQWINRADPWLDPDDPDWPVQLGGGFSYVVDGGLLGSTRFDDLPTDRATRMQDRTCGVGYATTATRLGDLRVDRVVFAPDHEARALIVEVTVSGVGDEAHEVGLVEVWDPNRSQLPVAFLTSDLASEGLTDNLERQRRALTEGFVDLARWSEGDRIATVTSRALDPVAPDPQSPAAFDAYPDPVFLAVLSDDTPDAVWLDDAELWDGPERPIPERVALPGSAADRSVERPGYGQHALLAVRVPVSIPAGGARTVRFAFGLAPAGTDVIETVAALRAEGEGLREATASAWRDRLVWAAFPGLPGAGALQRELAWSTYGTLASTSYDAYHQLRVVGQGGSYRFVHGVDGAMGDLALFAEALHLVDPPLAADTLRFALAQQRASARDDAGRYPYATTGVGSFTDVGLYDQRSDVYHLLPAEIGAYVATTRDDALLDALVPYWPRSDAEEGTVLDHLRTTLAYAETELGIGAGGLPAMGTGDYADGVLNLTTEPTSRTGTSSTFNAGFVINGFPGLADAVASRDPALADHLRELALAQRDAYAAAWLGDHYARGFADNGRPLAPDALFLEPQALALLADLPDDDRASALISTVRDRLDTPIGIMTTSAAPEVGGIDQPQVGGVWPVASAWWTTALARRDPEAGWDSLVRNTLSAHAVAYPELWYGTWTGPDSFYGPDAERPGEADAHLATALTDYPALNAHVHAGPLRALTGALGIEGTATGLRIDPHVPTETYAVRWPRLSLWSTPDGIGGTWAPSGTGPATLEITLPSGLRGRPVRATVDGRPAEVETTGDRARLNLAPTADAPLTWALSPG